VPFFLFAGGTRAGVTDCRRTGGPNNVRTHARSRIGSVPRRASGGALGGHTATRSEALPEIPERGGEIVAGLRGEQRLCMGCLRAGAIRQPRVVEQEAQPGINAARGDARTNGKTRPCRTLRIPVLAQGFGRRLGKLIAVEGNRLNGQGDPRTGNTSSRQ